MSAAAQVLTSGLLTGIEYAVVAVGLGLIFRVARVLNLAHGAFFALGAYIAYQTTRWEWTALAGAVPAAVSGLLLGALVEWALVRRVRGQPLTAAIVLLALGIAAEELFILLGGASYYSVPLRLPPLLFGWVVVGTEQVAAAAISAATLGAIALFLRSHWGLAVRTAAADPEIASLCGVDVSRVRTATFGVACALAAATGAFLSPLTIISPTMGRVPLILSLVMIFIGGPGRLGGTLLAGLGVGVASTAVSYYLTSPWSYILGLLVIIAVTAWLGRGGRGVRM